MQTRTMRYFRGKKTENTIKPGEVDACAIRCPRGTFLCQRQHSLHLLRFEKRGSSETRQKKKEEKEGKSWQNIQHLV